MARVLRPIRVGDLDSVIKLQHKGAVTALGHIFPQDRYPFPVAAIRRQWMEDLAGDVQCFVIEAQGHAIQGLLRSAAACSSTSGQL
jgi:hypothetical protein